MSSNERSCGSCTLCCKVLHITELEKPAGQWCRECVPGKGCSIYAHRPEVCREYQCLWLAGALPDWFYPARSKIVVGNYIIAGRDTLTVVVDPSYSHRWREEPYYSEIRQLAEIFIPNGVPTVVIDRGEIIWLTPQGELNLDRVPEELRAAAAEYVRAGEWS